MKLSYSFGLCLVGLFGLFGFHGVQSFDQTFHNTLTQNATVLCYTNATDYCMRFTLQKNSDTVAHVFTRNHTDPTQNSADLFPPPVETEVIFDFCWTVGPIDLSGPLTAAFLPYLEGVDVVSVDFISKSFWDSSVNDTITFPEDVLYKSSCNVTEMVDAVITSGILNVTGVIDETPVNLFPAAKLEVFDGSTNAVTTTKNLGDGIYLKASILPPAVPSSSDPTGVFVFDCWVCDVATCDGSKTILVEQVDGCPNMPQIGPFTASGTSSRTLTFPAFQLNNEPSMYFRCKAGFCFDVNDAKCVNYCASTGGKRKRRAADVDEEEENVATVVVHFVVSSRDDINRLTGDVDIVSSPDDINRMSVDDVNNMDERQQPVEPTASQEPATIGLIAAVVTLAGLLLIGVVIGVAVFFRVSRRTPVNEKA